MRLEVSVLNNQGQTHALSAAEAAKPLPRKDAKQPDEASAAPAKQRAPKVSPKVVQREPSPPTSEQAEEGQAQKGAVVPAGFSLGQDSSGQSESVVPQLLDARGELLPQTKDLPGTDSAFFKQIGPTLFKAIVDNNPELMLPYFMPVPVYEKLKDSKNPPRDWKYRLFAQLKRDIERYHRALGSKRERAHFVALDVVPEDALWMKPGREYNKLPYYRLFGSSLRYVDYRGRERRFEVSALFSWRGEWYVVHLNGLK